MRINVNGVVVEVPIDPAATMHAMGVPCPCETCCAARVKAWNDGARDALNSSRRAIVQLTKELPDLDDPNEHDA